MKVEIDYEIVSEQEFEEIKKNCTRLMTELLFDLYFERLRDKTKSGDHIS